MKNSFFSRIAKRMSMLLVIMSGLLGIATITHIGSLPIAFTLMLSALSIGMLLLPITVKKLSKKIQAVILSLALFAIPLFIMIFGSVITIGKFPSLTAPLFYVQGGNAITVAHSTIALIALVGWFFAFEWYLQKKN